MKKKVYLYVAKNEESTVLVLYTPNFHVAKRRGLRNTVVTKEAK